MPSANWPEQEGTVHQVNADLSYPREEIVYYYSTDSGYLSGFYWRWFEVGELTPIRAGDQIRLRYHPKQHDRSVFVGAAAVQSPSPK